MGLDDVTEGGFGGDKLVKSMAQRTGSGFLATVQSSVRVSVRIGVRVGVRG